MQVNEVESHFVVTVTILIYSEICILLNFLMILVFTVY